LRLIINARWVYPAALLFAAPVYAAAPPPSVVVTPVSEQNIAPSFSNIGHVMAIQSVKIMPRITAFINEVNFKQGSTVKAGQVLFTLQPEQYEAALETAKANVASAQAALANAELIYGRAVNLKQTGFEAQSALDTALATRNEDQASLLSAQAMLANAALNLSYCTITAPIDGRIGAVVLTKGNLVTTTSGTLATINQLNPIRVEFSVSANSPILAAAQADPSESQFAISLDLPDGKPYPIKGKIAFLDNQVDTNTGTVNVYADFANPNGLLLPGAYVNVDTAPVQAQQVLLVPISAVQTDQNSSYVLTVGTDNKVAQQTVTLGDQIGQNFIVKSGIKLGDRVIVDGVQKVKVGDAVTVTTAAATMSAQSQ
jgi:membrane fusion protein, multidrug efflux system